MSYNQFFEGEGVFCEVAEKYYNRNFGTISKSEIDLLMFKILYNRLSRENNENLLSDASLALGLGVTKQKIRSLKERMFLKYSNDVIDWRTGFNDLVSAGAVDYDRTRDRFTILVLDPSLKYSIENELETRRLIADYTHNQNLLVLTRRAFIYLAYESCNDVNKRMEIEQCLIKETNENEAVVRNQLEKKTFWTRFGEVLRSPATGTILSILGFAFQLVG